MAQKIHTLHVEAEITAGALQVIAAEVLGWIPGVNAGHWSSVDLAPADAVRVRDELVRRGYRVRPLSTT